ncbi:desampylase [Halalkalirubrum salinum]|uniref:desampylase n=1 Tax=Halalkalirubrum salinum TaxID=2563889 RepID=UPI0010FAF91D|nr:desampylase [Halalkalirubrum salinum]
MIQFSRSAYDEIVYQAYNGGDEEICGVLAGEYDAGHSRVTDTYAAENVAETPQTRYVMDPEEQFEIIETIEDAGLEIVGFYHSHPAGPTNPSKTDADRATWPEYSYVICALDGYPFVGSWRWRADEEAFEQETIAVEQH